MTLNFVVFMAVASVVKGSVIVNVLDSNTVTPLPRKAKPEQTHSLDICNYQACDQLCRRLGFPGGACVGDKCQCDNFEPLPKESNSLAHLHLEAGRKAKANSLDACDYQACDELCRRLGFTKGFCVGDDCKCVNFEPKPQNGNSLAHLHLEAGRMAKANSLDACDYQACDGLCRSLGFTKGFCVGDDCKCVNFEPKPQNGNSLAHLHLEAGSKPKINSLDTCNYQACDQLCRRLGFPGGACVGNKCQCDSFEPLPEENKASHFPLREASTVATFSLYDCKLRACEQLCQYLGFPRGACVGDRCVCDNFRKGKGSQIFAEPAVYKKHESGDNKKLINLKDVLHKAANNVKEDCNFFNCNLWCSSLNYIGGTCVGDWCQCY